MGHPARPHLEAPEKPLQGRWLRVLSRAGRGVVSHLHADWRYGAFRTDGRARYHGPRPHRELALWNSHNAHDRGPFWTRWAGDGAAPRVSARDQDGTTMALSTS